jgi:hypothetical protein
MVQDWKQFLSQDEDGLDTIRKYVRTGRPWGADQWVKTLEHQLGRQLLPKKGGWPKGRDRKP